MRKLLVALCCLAFPVFAAEDQRAVKEKLVADIEQLIDVRELAHLQLQFIAQHPQQRGVGVGRH